MQSKNPYSQNLKLALPIMLSSLGQQLVQMVDTLMVGTLGTASLAAVSFAFALTYNALVIGMGISMALTPLTGQNYAKGKKDILVNLFENSLSLNTLLSLLLVAVLLGLLPFLHLFGQPTEVINECKSYYVIVALSFIPMLWFLTFKQFLEGIDNTKAAMIITISANVLNIFLNWVFIFGKLGFAPMGVFGAGLSTFISRLLSPIAFLIYIRVSKDYKMYIKQFQWQRLSFYMHKCLLRIGVPIAGQMFIEFFSLFGITIMMGWVSTAALASYQIINTMISTSFLAASGICSATTVLVSHAYGLNDEKEIKKQFYAGWKMVLLIMGTVALIFIFFGRYVAMLFSNDAEVIQIAYSLFLVAGVFQLIDGTQVSGLAGLRGINDVTRPMLYAVIAYLFVALPSAYLCGFVLKLGTWSIFAGFMFGLITAGILYHTRFHKTLRRKFHK
ncbi:MAG: MATE family efflux transporter [Bacteroidales bacterium]|nr:MATE family efflux transporter [Bacteroidales bacterium]